MPSDEISGISGSGHLNLLRGSSLNTIINQIKARTIIAGDGITIEETVSGTIINGSGVTPLLAPPPPTDCTHAAQAIVFDASFTGHIDTRSPLFIGADVSAATVAKTCTPCVAVCTADPVLITSGSSLCAQTRFAPEVILNYNLDDMAGPWSIDLEVSFNYPDGDTDKCSSAFFGEGSVNNYIVNVALGADPSGSHTFTFNDGENPVANSIVYTYHVTITMP